MIEKAKQKLLDKKLNVYFLCEGNEKYEIKKEVVVPANPTCNCYSVAKAFTVTAIGLLYDKGLLSTKTLITDVLKKYLPNEIEYCGKRGYLTVDTYSLSWTAYHAQQLIIAKTFSMPIGIDTNIFDVFILALEFVINNNLNNEE